MKEQDDVINKSLAALDQFWSNIESTYPLMCMMSSNIPETLSTSEREVLQNCCRLIAWELAIRNLQKNRAVKCSLKHEGPKYSFVEITSIAGPAVFEVESSKITQDKTMLSVIGAYRMSEDQFIVFLPTEIAIPPIFVPSDQILDDVY